MSVARTTFAFVAAPVASSLTLAVFLAASAGGQPGALLAGTMVYGFSSLFFTVPATALAGAPALLLLKLARRDNLPWLMAAGALIGLGAGGLVALGGGTPDIHREPVWILLSMSAIAGAVGGAVFSLVRGRPDGPRAGYASGAHGR